MLNGQQIAELKAELLGYLGGCNGGKAEDIPQAPANPGDFADRGTHQQEGFRASALNANRSQLCSQVESALGRIESGRYSDKCAVCGRPIPFERLMATPWAVTHVRREGKCVLGVVPVED